MKCDTLTYVACTGVSRACSEAIAQSRSLVYFEVRHRSSDVIVAEDQEAVVALQ